MNETIDTIRASKEFIIYPGEIKQLKLGEAIFVSKQDFSVRKVMLRRGIV